MNICSRCNLQTAFSGQKKMAEKELIKIVKNGK